MTLHKAPSSPPEKSGDLDSGMGKPEAKAAESGGSAGKLLPAPISFEDASAFVRELHRHHTPPQGHKFSIAAMLGSKLVGVVSGGACDE